MLKIKGKNLAVISIIVLLVFFSLFSFFFLYYRNKNQGNLRYIYPNPLHTNATLSDMIVENDTYINFITSNHDYYSKKSGPTYSNLDISNEELEVDFLSPSSISTALQVKLYLSHENKPIVYLYSLNSFFDEVGVLLTKNNNVWETYPTLDEWPWYHSSVTRGPIFDFQLDSNNKSNFGYIYHGSSINRDLDSPVIFNETSNSWIFLNNTFIEIQGKETYAPGDFIIFNNNIAMTWTRVINDNYSQPLVVIYWKNEGWKLYSVGSSSQQLIPISLFYQEEKLNLFYYNPGNIYYNGSIHHLQFTNSTDFNDRKIADIEGKIRFYSDSICSLFNMDYLFFYSKRILTIKPQYDVFLGIFNGTSLREIQITNTEEFDEYYVNCDLSLNYIHYIWTQCPYNENEILNPYESAIFYNRISITEIQGISFNLVINSSTFLTEVKYEKQNPVLNVLKKKLNMIIISIRKYPPKW